MSRSSRRTALIIAAAVTALGTLIGGIAAWESSGKAANNATADNDGTAVTGGQINTCVASAPGATVSCVSPAPVNPAADDQAAERSILGSKNPVRPGPWPFTVLYDQVAGKYLGVWVRNNPDSNGFHIGLAAHAQPVWVDCLAESSFNPEPGLPTGPHWYKVHWPSTSPSDAPMSSSPSNPAQGWAYAYYLRPNGTNGQVPTC